MRGDVYLGTAPAGSGRTARVILAVLMTVVLLASSAYGVYLKMHRDTALDAMKRFEEAMAGGRYADALRTLRDVQSRVAGADASGGGGADLQLYRDSLAGMERQVTERVDDVLARTGDAATPLTEDDRRFLEDMGEMTGMLLSARLRGLCTGLLTGTTLRSSVDSAYLVLGSLPNLSQPARALRQELDTIESSAAPVREAETSLAGNRYFDALSQFAAIAAEATGFVQEYALGRILDVKEAMLSPLTGQARQWLDSGRYYSARDLLNELKAVFPDHAGIESMLGEASANTAQTLEVFSGSVEHINVRPLIVTASRAFDGDAMSDSLAQGMLTVSEFRSLLEGLYGNGYILIDIGRLLDENGQPAAVLVPPGKKPLILTVEGVNYYAHRAANGLCTNLVLDADGNVCGQYLDDSGTLRTERTAEAIGILEEFVETHPDFSFDGAKGILSLTGYECVFGYVLNADQLARRNENNTESGLAQQTVSAAQMTENAQQVRALATRLSESGWRFASSTYGFLEPGNPETTLEMLQEDADKWDAQVGAYVGGTDILMYPNGSFLNGDDPRCLMYRSLGYRFFAGIGPNAYAYYRDNYVYMDRTAINGYTLSNDDLSRFFDVRSSRDPSRPA